VRDKSLEFVARHFANPKLYPLGSNDYAYSNVGYITLGWIIEKLGGEPFEQFLKKNIIDKLEMKDTFIFPSKASTEQRSRIANVDRRPPDVLDIGDYDKTRPRWRYPSPEAGLYSTAKDLRQFLSIFRHKGKIPGYSHILSEGSIKQLMEDQVPKVNFGCDGQIGRGLGFDVTRQGGCFSMPGLDAGSIFHGGRYHTFFWYNPVKDEIGVFLLQKITRRDEKTSYSYRGERQAFMQLVERIKTN